MKNINFSISRVKARIAFVGDFKYNFGSSNTILNYVRTGAALGYEFRVSEFGNIDKIVRGSIPVAKKNWKPDLFVFVYESYQFLSDEDIDQICSFIPRSQRIIIDPDGKYSQPESISGDTNHSTPDSYKYWKNLYDVLSDIVLQPTIKPVESKKIQSFLYFGMGYKNSSFIKRPKKFDLIYVGNNWYRWSAIYFLIKAIAPIRSRLKRVALIGEYWSNKILPVYEGTTYSDVNFLKKNNIEILEPTPYGQVETTMSMGLINPVFVRPILNKLKFVTPRMFETFTADTVPLIPKYFTHAQDLYGSDVNKLLLSNNPTRDILKILDNYKTYNNLCREIREMLNKKHSYKTRINQLLKFA
ncbi:MAG: hypothetical protein AAB531_01765 [Patescibacteria group bacterium]